MLNKAYIRPSVSPWGAPMLSVRTRMVLSSYALITNNWTRWKSGIGTHCHGLMTCLIKWREYQCSQRLTWDQDIIRYVSKKRTEINLFLYFCLFKQNQVCKLISFGDVAGELRMLEVGGRVKRWLDGVGDSWEAFGDFLEVFSQFSLKIGHFKKTYRMY